MKTKDIIAILLTFALGIAAILCSIIKVTDTSRMEPITDFIEVELEKNETCRLETLVPVGKTTDGKGTVFSDDGSELWILNNFYAEPSDTFVALMNDKGTKDKTDDVIVDIWLDLE
jgi:hypothetical protein